MTDHRPGVNKPLSTGGPTPLDLRVDQELEAFLLTNMICESEEGNAKRIMVISMLQDMLREWAITLGEKKGIIKRSEYGPIEGAAQLHTFGSQRLDVHAPDSDVDVLCICPNFISRADFFGSFCEHLASSEHSSMVLPVPDAYTPVLKFNFMEQPVDMIFVSLFVKAVPQELNLLDDSILLDQDEKGIRSLNGVRVALFLVQNIPNFLVFRTALRAIKFWGRSRGIYSNVLGFLGGINFALLVAFICQLHPNTCAACIVQRFFKLFYHWQWPNPVMIAPPVEYQSSTSSSWNYMKHLKDRSDIMPIITPCFPQMNSAYNVSLPQFRVIQEEIMRGYGLLARWSKESSLDKWAELFTPNMPTFFTKFPRFVQVDIISSSGEANHRRWFSWCESRMRLLLRGVEMPNYIFCHPVTTCYHRKQSQQDVMEGSIAGGAARAIAGTEVFSSLDLEQPITYNTNRVGHAVAHGLKPENVYSSTYFLGLTFCNGIRSVDLTTTIQDFVYRVSIYSDKTPDMNVSITALAFSSLPKFVTEQYPSLLGSIATAPAVTPLRLYKDPMSQPESVPTSAMNISIATPLRIENEKLFIADSLQKIDVHPNQPPAGDLHYIQEEGWVESQMEMSTPTVANVASSSEVHIDVPTCNKSISRNRRRNRTEFSVDAKAPDFIPPVVIDLSNSDVITNEEQPINEAVEEEDISPLKRSRVWKKKALS